MTTFRHDLDPIRAARQRRLWQGTLALAGVCGLLAVHVGLETTRAVAQGHWFAELGYAVALGLALCALAAAGLASIGEQLRGLRSGWWALGAGLAVALSPLALWWWAGLG